MAVSTAFHADRFVYLEQLVQAGNISQNVALQLVKAVVGLLAYDTRT